MCIRVFVYVQILKEVNYICSHDVYIMKYMYVWPQKDDTTCNLMREGNFTMTTQDSHYIVKDYLLLYI